MEETRSATGTATITKESKSFILCGLGGGKLLVRAYTHAFEKIRINVSAARGSAATGAVAADLRAADPPIHIGNQSSNLKNGF